MISVDKQKEILKEQDSGLKGPKGNLEHFVLLGKI